MTETNAAAAEVGEDLLHELFMKANTDAAFRRQLETDPAAACSAVGIDLPPGARFVCAPATPETAADVVARSKENEIHIPIVGQDEGELSDAQLKGVSGGVDSIGFFGRLEVAFNKIKAHFAKRWSELTNR